MLALTSLFLLLIHSSLGDPNAPCYFPSNETAVGYFPCDPNAYIVQCCPTGWTCYSNGLCAITDPATANATAPVGTSIRGTCTDPKWVNSICGEYCLVSLLQATLRLTRATEGQNHRRGRHTLRQRHILLRIRSTSRELQLLQRRRRLQPRGRARPNHNRRPRPYAHCDANYHAHRG
jgi:hypothetical protein